MSNISEICNNPLNIKMTKDNWKGRTGEHKGFVSFMSDRWGYRAAVKILLGYIADGLWTPKMIISKWAPSVENDVSAYCRAVEMASGGKLKRNEDLMTWGDLVELMKCMTLVERGVIGDADMIHSGIRLALPTLNEKQKKGYSHFGLYSCDLVGTANDRSAESYEAFNALEGV